MYFFHIFSLILLQIFHGLHLLWLDGPGVADGLPGIRVPQPFFADPDGHTDGSSGAVGELPLDVLRLGAEDGVVHGEEDAPALAEIGCGAAIETGVDLCV